jgi:hypothetical protein
VRERLRSLLASAPPPRDLTPRVRLFVGTMLICAVVLSFEVSAAILSLMIAVRLWQIPAVAVLGFILGAYLLWFALRFIPLWAAGIEMALGGLFFVLWGGLRWFTLTHREATPEPGHRMIEMYWLFYAICGACLILVGVILTEVGRRRSSSL